MRRLRIQAADAPGQAAVDTNTAAPAELLADRYVVTNRFRTRRGDACARFEKRWADRKSRLAELDGFRYFALLRRAVPEGEELDAEEYDYQSLTVWERKENFTAWRKGEAFKEAHGGGTVMGFVDMIVSSAVNLKGKPSPAMFEGLLAISAGPAEAGSLPPVEGGWRAVEADGLTLLDPENFVATNRFSVEEDGAAAFEQRWAQRESELLEMPGFRFFSMLRRDSSGDPEDPYNYISLTIWKDRASFDNWREGQAFKRAHGQADKPAGGPPQGGPPKGPPPGMKMPSPAFWEAKLVLENTTGI